MVQGVEVSACSSLLAQEDRPRRVVISKAVRLIARSGEKQAGIAGDITPVAQKTLSLFGLDGPRLFS